MMVVGKKGQRLPTWPDGGPLQCVRATLRQGLHNNNQRCEGHSRFLICVAVTVTVTVTILPPKPRIRQQPAFSPQPPPSHLKPNLSCATKLSMSPATDADTPSPSDQPTLLRAVTQCAAVVPNTHPTVKGRRVESVARRYWNIAGNAWS